MKPSEWTWPSANSGVDTDVVVVGGGMSGISAALAARRSGCRVLLAERHGFLGGAATAGSVAQFVGWATRAGRRVIRGIADEIAERLEATGGAAGFDVFTMSTGHRMDRLQYDPEILKVVLDSMLSEAGVTVLFHCALAGIEAGEGRVKALRIATQKGALEIRGTVFVDASGDMALLDAAGARFLERQPEGLQPATMMFAMAPVDFDAIATLDDAGRKAIVAKGLACGDLPRAALHYSRVPGSDIAWFNISRVNVDAADPFSMSAGEMEGRRQALRIAGFLRENLPGCERARLVQTAPQLGIRDTRRVAGDHVLSVGELRTGQAFDDVICCGAYPIDIHHPDGGGLTIEEFGEDHFYRIPLRSLLPEGLVNVAAAGRGISAEADAFAALRVMPTAMATGQAAGTAAALAVEAGGCYRGIDVDDLQARLRDAGAFLGN